MAVQANQSQEKSMQLTMRLLREGVTTCAALKDQSPLTKKNVINIEGAEFYIGTAFENPPEWTDFLTPHIEDMPEQEELKNQGVAAILMLPIPDTTRIMALCFGYAHIWLDLDKCERDFGLKVTLNKVNTNQLKGLELSTPDAVTFNKRVSASRASSLQEFNVDYNRELAFTASGKPEDTDFASVLAGNDSLKISCKVNFDTLPEKCKSIYDAYQSDEYKKNGFDWVDHIQRIKEGDLLEELDKLLYSTVNEMIDGESKDLHLFIPDLPDDLSFDKARFMGLGKRPPENEFDHLDVQNYVDLFDGKIDINKPEKIEECKSKHRLKIVSENGKHQEVKIYNSFVYEAEYNDGLYVLFRGQWYRVDKDFSKEVNAYFELFLTSSSTSIPNQTFMKNEEDLLEDWKPKANLVLLDKTQINPQGESHAKIEPCDFFSLKSEFIHLKDGHSSSNISHLWNQGLVSAKCFIGDAKFRSDLKEKVKKRGRGKKGFLPLLPNPKTKFRSEQYTIVYGIMREPYQDGSLGLPFFSKVSFRSVATQLINMRFNVKVNLIRKEVRKDEDLGSAA